MLALITPDSTPLKSSTWLTTGLKIILFLCWLCTLLALSRPQWVGDPVPLPTSGRDLLLAVDISPSMRQRDMRIGGQIVNRLVAVKSVVGEFVAQREGDRLGLILFGEQAYLQTPLTFDRKTLQTLLYEAQMGFAGSNGTAIGDAIGLAVKRLQDRSENHRVVILLTDGANNSGALDPIKAAQLASRAKVKIYTIGVGARGASGLDEQTLSEVAKITGGQFFRARNPAELDAIYQELNRLEPVDQEAETIRPTISLYHWPLSVAFILSLLIAVVRQFGRTYV
jgi:Ca-activated chloride channel family protein